MWRRVVVLFVVIVVGCGSEEAVAPSGYVAEYPVVLPEFMVERRAHAIAEAVDDILASGATNIRGRYERVFQHAAIVERYAAEKGVDPMRVFAIIAQESTGDPSKRSPVGAVGLMQLMPKTATGEGSACGLTHATQRTDPERNICTGTSYYAALTEQYHGDTETALARYNYGGVDGKFAALPADLPKTMWALHGTGGLPEETTKYVPLVLAWEGIFRFLAEHDAVPVVAAELMAAPEYRVGVSSHGRSGHREFRRSRRVITRMPFAVIGVVEESAPRVWYTAQRDDTYIGVVFIALDDSEPEVIDLLNPAFAVGGLTSGVRLLLPADRYTFHEASGDTSYASIAQEYAMTTALLLRWNGVWTDRDVIRARAQQCAQSGCDAGAVRPSVGTKLLTRVAPLDP